MSCNCSKMRLQLRAFEGCWAVRPLYRSHQECSTRKGTNSGRSNFVPGATAATPLQLTSTSSTSASSSCLDEKHSIALPLHAHPSLSLPLSQAHVRTHIHALPLFCSHKMFHAHKHKAALHIRLNDSSFAQSSLSLSLSFSFSFLHTHTLTHTCTRIPTYANKCEGVCEHCCLSATYLAVCSQPISFSCPQNRTELKRREHSGVRWTLDHDSSRFENWNFSAIAHNNNSNINNISNTNTTQETNAAVAENKNWLEVQLTHLVWVWFVRSKTY